MTAPAPEHTPTPGDLRPANPEPSGDQGFPEDVPLAEMNERQQAAFWKFQARKHEARAKARGDYDQIKAKADALDKKLDAEKSEHEKALDAARKEGFESARNEANEKAATAMLRAALSARGVKDDEIKDILSFTTFSAMVADGDIDGDKILAYANRLAGKPSESRVAGSGYPDMGQGQRGSAPRQSAREAAKAVAATRWKTESA